MAEGSGYQPIGSMEFFRDLETLCDEVWEAVSRWRPFDRDSTGIQLVKALDGTGANLAEGDGRYSDRDSLHFFTIARGSAREARYWLRRARSRELLSAEVANDYISRLESIMRRMNALISSRRSAANRIREQAASYELDADSFKN